MEMTQREEFRSGREAASPAALPEAIRIARRAVSAVTDLPIDAVAHTEFTDEKTWKVVVDVIESRARMGDNDLLAAFEVHIGADGEVLFCSRSRRYRREEVHAG